MATPTMVVLVRVFGVAIFADGPTDNANGTLFEHDYHSNQLRHGGDVAGLADSLDYLQGMGIKGIYIAGSAFMNLPWAADGRQTRKFDDPSY